MVVICKKCGERSARIVSKKDFVKMAAGGFKPGMGVVVETAALLKALLPFIQMIIEHFKDQSTPIAVCEKCGHYEKADV
ncbi:hypothetical protein [Pseudomonas nitroreducens]|uniref:hypothetical protein n=1 Tax=Pseudomonas nitroreducens TaxID=46680 RepID=UPI00351D613E